MTIYDFTATAANGDEIPLSDYKGKVLLIANTASKCGFTPQYEGLEALYEQYGDKDFTVLTFPCNQFANQEPGTDDEIQNFCKLNYGVTFPVMAKIEVNGDNAHPLFQYLKEQAPGTVGKAIKWNFTKFLIDAEGHVYKRYAPSTAPDKLKEDIGKLLAKIPAAAQ